MIFIRAVGRNLCVAVPSPIGERKGGTTLEGDRTLYEINASAHLVSGEQSDHMHTFSILVTKIIGIRRRNSRN